MGCESRLEDMEYAWGCEKMYGVTDEQLRFPSWHQGNTLSLAETTMIIERDLAIPGKPLREHLEVVDADAAFAEVRRVAAAGLPLAEAVVLDIHRLVAAHLREAEAGEYRWDVRYVISSSAYPPPGRVASLMSALLALPSCAVGSLRRRFVLSRV